jgi:hypothetical protein
MFGGGQPFCRSRCRSDSTADRWGLNGQFSRQRRGRRHEQHATESPYGGGTVTGQSTFTGPSVPAGLTGFNPPNVANPTPQGGSVGSGAAGLSHPLAGLWAGAMLGSLLSQAMFPGNNMPGGAGGPMGGGMNPLGAPSPFGSSGFTPGLRGTGGVGSMPQGNTPSSGMGDLGLSRKGR